MSVYFLKAQPQCRTKRKRVLRARLERVFDKLYAAAEKVLKTHRPCQVRMNQHGASCLDCRLGGVVSLPSRVNILCCGGCKWHSNKGCIANKPLTCRVWLCSTAQESDPEAYRKLERIADRADRLGLCKFRGDKKASIQNALDYFRPGHRTQWIYQS